MPELEAAVGVGIGVFARYPGSQGGRQRQNLRRGELRALLERELPGFLQAGERVARGGGQPWSWGQNHTLRARHPSDAQGLGLRTLQARWAPLGG